MSLEEEKNKVIDGLKSQIVYLEEEIKLIKECKTDIELVEVLHKAMIRSSARINEKLKP